MKPRPDHIAKVQDAITVLKGRGVAHYRPQIAKFTGLSPRTVQQVLEHLEAKAKSNPTGRITIPWTRMKGDRGGIATSQSERRDAEAQRDSSIQSQLENHETRLRAEYLRVPLDDKLAVRWARYGRKIGRTRFAEVRAVVDEKHLQALVDSGMDVLPAYRDHLVLMTEIDAL
jgi:alkylated DNA nucleotide flippase Atl1